MLWIWEMSSRSRGKAPITLITGEFGAIGEDGGC